MRKAFIWILLVLITLFQHSMADIIGYSTGGETLIAKWEHHLGCTAGNGYKKGQHNIISRIWPHLSGPHTIWEEKAADRYESQVKVTTWGKPFSITHYSNKKQIKHTFTVSLYKSANPREMKARFKHTVWQKGRVKMYFSGIAIMHRIH